MPGCSASPASHAQAPTHAHTRTQAHPPALAAHGPQAKGRQRNAAAHTGEDGFVSVLGGTSRDLQLLRTDKVGWDFLQEERTTVRKTPPGNEKLTRGPGSITRDVSSWDEPRPQSRSGGTPSREAPLGEELGVGGQDRDTAGTCVHQGAGSRGIPRAPFTPLCPHRPPRCAAGQSWARSLPWRCPALPVPPPPAPATPGVRRERAEEQRTENSSWSCVRLWARCWSSSLLSTWLDVLRNFSVMSRGVQTGWMGSTLPSELMSSISETLEPLLGGKGVPA